MLRLLIISSLSMILFVTHLSANEIHQAAFANKPDRIQEAFSKGDGVNAINDEGMWPLLIACTYGHLESVKKLISLGANVNFSNNSGYTALHEASYLGYEKIVQILLEAGADVNKRDINHFNALNYAQMNDARKVIRILKRHKAVE